MLTGNQNEARELRSVVLKGDHKRSAKCTTALHEHVTKKKRCSLDVTNCEVEDGTSYPNSNNQMDTVIEITNVSTMPFVCGPLSAETKERLCFQTGARDENTKPQSAEMSAMGRINSR